MRILYIDCDSLRPDHLGCYGYHRDTSPNVDALAEGGAVFTNYYASDAPCLPSRTSLYTGQFGIHTGVVNHGGRAADVRSQGPDREFANRGEQRTFPMALKEAGYRTAMISSFPTRHAAWHVLDGVQDWDDPSREFDGRGGTERAEYVAPIAESWLRENAAEDDWFLSVNFWDPHIPYDTPQEYGNPFENEQAPGFPSEDVIEAQRDSYGPRSARDIHGWGSPYVEGGDWGEDDLPRTPSEIGSREDFKEWIDGYDVGVRYMDDYIGDLFDVLREEGVYEGTFVVLSADHGENQGELNVYGDHQTADDKTCRVPLIVSGPGVDPGERTGLWYNVDFGPTVADLAGVNPSPQWGGRSFAAAITDGKDGGREYLVLGQGAWSCQRAVRWDDWLMIRTYHKGMKDLDDVMLFDLASDPHEQNDLSEEEPDVAAEGVRKLERWYAEQMRDAAMGQSRCSPTDDDCLVDPLWRVIAEGGPYHAMRTDSVEPYIERLRETGRKEHADALAEKHLD
ncbi:sulfatase family protein [Saliphagus infecundisoli]|uniref:Sulfatase n=1 Tax=Saliphagus infecundisoli TaxID=1849069 RepID=A0ABD5QAI7_9EURY|nr:sulfatase [Saliphagus infecundisoli]